MTDNRNNTLGQKLSIDVNDLSDLSTAQLHKVETVQAALAPGFQTLATTSCCQPSKHPKLSAPSSACCPAPSTDSGCASPDASSSQDTPCCGPRVMPKLTYRTVASEYRDSVPYISSELTTADRIGAIRARLGRYRMNYAIQPGLYALGNPGRQSHVLVTANYKLSFDHLRRHLRGQNVWILVLDTWGINVWCAAGKGTFGTAQLIRQIQHTDLSSRVDTRRVIVPQLGAPGVAAHEVKRETGFSVVWGPVEAADIPDFIDAGCNATPRMRQKRFPIGERAVLLPIELRPALKLMLATIAIASPLAAIAWTGNYLTGVVHYMVVLALYLFGGVFSGAVLTPLLLPFLPGRAFSLKSLGPGVAAATLLTLALRTQISEPELIAFSLLLMGVASYTAMNYTGASTYTSISGVKKEMRIAVPAQIASVSGGVVLWITTQILM